MINIVIITIALSVNIDSCSNMVFVKTTDGDFEFDINSKNGSSLLTRINRSIEFKKNIALVLSQNTSVIQNSYWPMEDRVVSISEITAKKNLMRVNLQMRPTSVFIDKQNVQFKETYSLLQLSLKEEKLLILAINPINVFIETAILKK